MATWVIQTIENWRIERFNIQCKVAPIYWLMGLPFNAFSPLRVSQVAYSRKMTQLGIE